VLDEYRDADHADRFEGKVAKSTASCRGGQHALDFMAFPWVDWGNYFATGDAHSMAPGNTNMNPLSPNGIGVGGALLGQKRYDEAEPLLLKGYDGMKQRSANIPPQAKERLTEAAERLLLLYTR
jgi:hypothetical protein